MSSEERVATLVGFGAAAAILGVLFWLVGVDEVLGTLGRADPAVLGLIALALVGWLLAWSGALRVVLGVLGVHLSVTKSVLVYASAVFANNVTPFGQAGGEPLSAWVISEVSGTEYETGLAAIASVDALNFVPSIGLALVGVVYYATEASFGGRLELVAASVVGLAVLAPAAALLFWRHRYAVERRLVEVLTPAFDRLGEALPRVSPPDAGAVRQRVEGFFHAIERVALGRRQLAAALSLSAVGWLLQSAGLWMAFVAVDARVPLYVALFVVPIGAIAGVVPTPGGLGGIEAVNVALLTLATGVDPATVTAAVTVHRVGGFLLMTSIGGGSMATLGVTG